MGSGTDPTPKKLYDTDMLTMQDALLRLTEYWTSRGCMVTQPMNTEVGAGTYNPATALRVLGPEPWRVAYVEPSVRPDDSRYGENPNRLQTHTQFQVILKPDPGNPQELYLGSLQALGIDIASHDVRFVEDNWTSPALGAWGLGWEVWLDGLEITQFTYFQQAGGVSLDPVSVELTYGMERIIMALQGVRHFKEITYAPGISYGEVFGQAEYELSRYYLDDADIEANQKLFQIYAQEAERLIELRLPIPAHSYVLKCSHTFNILDSRGAISTTERARAFARMRGLAQQAAKLWLERRQEIGHPLGVTTTEPTPPPTLQSWPQIESPSPLVFEIGVEEMPPAEVTRIVDVIRASLTEKLAASRLKHGLIEVFASPRRIVACIADVAPAELDYDRTERGPRLTAAFDQSGAPTKAAIGFARSKGIEVEKLQQIQIDDAIYVGLVQRITGRPAAQVLSGILPEIVTELRSEKNMRWGAPGLSFTRPIRWLLALLGEQVVPFTVSTLTSGRTTHVHRFAAVPVVEVTTAADYLGFLRGHGIIADPAERRQEILRLADELAASVNGKVDLSGEAGVIDEIVNLVEQPTPILGHFDQRYLELPGEILTTVMKKHQRYLPLRDHSGQLLPHFLAVANGSCDHDLVRSGNEAVLRARYEDARFFWQADLKTPPELMKQGLIKLTFESRLGSIADRAQRIEAIANQLATPLPLTNEETRTLTRAGQLAKFDLGSNMVVELTSLAGIMAREYAIHAHESESVAQALYEMELPRQAGDRLPSTLPGAILALADRFDLLTGLFAINAAPTGSSDPFGLRRAALGVTSILLAESRLASIGLHQALALAAAHQPVAANEEAHDAAYRFIMRRFEQHLLDTGHPTDIVRAIRPLADTPTRAMQAATELAQMVNAPLFHSVAQAMQRVRRIVPTETKPEYQGSALQEPAELSLQIALSEAQKRVRPASTLTDFTSAIAPLIEPINNFFDQVLVMAEDPTVKQNRLGLLASVSELSHGSIDWSALVLPSSLPQLVK